MAENYLDKPLAAYLADAADNKPTPGGGSVAALVGALASAMASMAANFTVGREKFAAVEPQVRASLKLLDEARRKFLDLMHRDMEAYEGVRAAYRLPKATDAERAARRAAVQEALGQSLLVPLKVTKVAVQVLEASEQLANIANPNLLSDVAVAAVLAEATFAAGRINIEVNLDGLEDRELVASTRVELDASEAVAARLKDNCLEAVKARKR